MAVTLLHVAQEEVKAEVDGARDLHIREEGIAEGKRIARKQQEAKSALDWSRRDVQVAGGALFLAGLYILAQAIGLIGPP